MQRAGDYDTPIGRVPNSYTRDAAGSGGFGYYPGKQFFSFDYSFNRKRYGIPFDPAEEISEIVLQSTATQHSFQWRLPGLGVADKRRSVLVPIQ
jgi:hypothetical protein